MAAYDASPEDSGLGRLMRDSPDVRVHTSVAAEAAFLLGLAAVSAVGFSLTMFVAVACAAAGVVMSVAGLVATSRPGVAGAALAPVGMGLALCTLVLVGLRYLGLDTAFGDAWAPQLRGLLSSWNDLLPSP